MAAPNPQPAPENRVATRVFGALVIVLGAALVVYVFMTARQMFDTPVVVPTPAPTPKPLPGATPAPANVGAELGSAFGKVVIGDLRRLLALLVMCVAGSLLAALGIRLWGKR